MSISISSRGIKQSRHIDIKVIKWIRHANIKEEDTCNKKENVASSNKNISYTTNRTMPVLASHRYFN